MTSTSSTRTVPGSKVTGPARPFLHWWRAAAGLALAASASLASMAAGGAAPAGADQYGPVAQCSLSVTPTSVFAGQPFTVTVSVGTGPYPAGTVAPVLLSGSSTPLGTVAIPTAGSASATFTTPASTGPGLHEITVQGCSAILATSVVVQPSSSPASGSAPAAVPAATPAVPQAAAAAPVASGSSVLAFTGADIAATVAAGAVAVGLGGGLILLSRKRRGRK